MEDNRSQVVVSVVGERTSINVVSNDNQASVLVGLDPVPVKIFVSTTSGGFTSVEDIERMIADALEDESAAKSHVHGNISNDGRIGVVPGLIVKTGPGGVLTALPKGEVGQFLFFDGTWQTPPETDISGLVDRDTYNLRVETVDDLINDLETNKLNRDDERVGKWDEAYSWGDHAGLYRPIGWSPNLSGYALVNGSSLQDFAIKNLTIHGTVNHWLGEVITIENANLQLNATEGGARINSGLIIYDVTNTTELSKLYYDVNSRWKLDSEFIATESYVDSLINGLPDTIDWSKVTSKPTWLSPTTKSTFEAAHSHTWEQVTGLQGELDKKVDKITGFSLMPNTEIIRLSTVYNQDISGKADKSQVLTNVPANAKFTDTVYTHPSTHLPSIITQDANNRFVSDSEKALWNAKGSSNLGLGETSTTAYRGDRGKLAYDHSLTTHAPVNAQKNSDITKGEIEAKLTGVISTHSHTVTKANVGLGNVDNTSDLAKPISTATQTALNAKLGTGAQAYDSARLGNYPASDYARKGQNETITGSWNFSKDILLSGKVKQTNAAPRYEFFQTDKENAARWVLDGDLMQMQVLNYSTGAFIRTPLSIDLNAPSGSMKIEINGSVLFGNNITANNGTFTGNVTAQKGTLSSLNVNNNTTSEIKVGVANGSSAINRESSILLGISLATTEGHFWRLQSRSTSAWANHPSFTIGNNPVSGGAFTNALTILSNRNVGLGIDNPLEGLHVKDFIRTNRSFKAYDVYPGIEFFSTNTNTSCRWVLAGGPALYLQVINSSSQYISDPVSFAINAPTGSFRVNSTGAVTTGSDLYVGGNVSANNITLTGNLTSNSDVRLKDDIHPVGNILDRVMMLDTVSYHFKKDKSKRNRIGMLAHNVRALFPEFVEEDRTKNKYLSVDYAGMSVIAIRTTQELNEIVKQQGMLIKELEGKLNG